jgi:hypothetical protein
MAENKGLCYDASGGPPTTHQILRVKPQINCQSEEHEIAHILNT